MMSAQGQDAMQIEKATCMNTSITGYGPLIFDIHQKSSFSDVMIACRQVWTVLQKDKSLPKKLVIFEAFMRHDSIYENIIVVFD